MRFDLVFPLIDLPEMGNSAWYSAACAMMLASARHAFAGHDVRYVQITDGASEVADGVDVRFFAAAKVERAELMQYRGHCTAEWALSTDRPVIFCDVDLLWNNDGIVPLLDQSAAPDITLFARQFDPFQPFNGGLIVTQPGQKLFWETYRTMMRRLPNDIKGWWGDQIALGVMCGSPQPGQKGVVRFGSRIGFLPIDLVAPSPRKVPITALLDTPACHFKGGKRKPEMPAYFDMIQRKWSAKAAAE